MSHMDRMRRGKTNFFQKAFLASQAGFSLLEITVSVAIFMVLMVLATGIFQSVVKGQQTAIASQDTQESLRYVFEVMSKEARNAKRGDDGSSHMCQGSDGGLYRVFNTESIDSFSWSGDSDVFYFKNKYGWCVFYYLANGQLMARREDPDLGTYTAAATPDSVEVTDFSVFISDNPFGAPRTAWIQPRVTINLTAKAKTHDWLDNEAMIQTTISSRMYE